MSLRGAARRSNLTRDTGHEIATPRFARLAMTQEHGDLRITFTTPLTGVAPGQAVVLTDGDRVLGGAQIIVPHG